MPIIPMQRILRSFIGYALCIYKKCVAFTIQDMKRKLLFSCICSYFTNEFRVSIFNGFIFIIPNTGSRRPFCVYLSACCRRGKQAVVSFSFSRNRMWPVDGKGTALCGYRSKGSQAAGVFILHSAGSFVRPTTSWGTNLSRCQGIDERETRMLVVAMTTCDDVDGDGRRSSFVSDVNTVCGFDTNHKKLGSNCLKVILAKKQKTGDFLGIQIQHILDWNGKFWIINIEVPIFVPVQNQGNISNQSQLGI